jgi:hypothetical protein
LAVKVLFDIDCKQVLWEVAGAAKIISPRHLDEEPVIRYIETIWSINKEYIHAGKRHVRTNAPDGLE